MMLSSSSSPTISTTFLGLLAASVKISLVAAKNNITVEQLYEKLTSTTAALPGFNVEGGSVFTNFADALNNEQLFILDSGSNFYETPEREPFRFSDLHWCSDLTFSDVNNSSLIGYAGRCVVRFLGENTDLVASGAQVAFDSAKGGFMYTTGISAVYVEQTNVFEGQYHMDTDDNTWRFWDDGRKTMPMIAWEGHDEGDMSPNAAASSFSRFAQITWMSVEEVAQLFNTSVDEFTPEKFKQAYLDTWIKDHEFEAAKDNPNAEAELAIIEQVKNETNYVDETAAPDQPDSTAAEEDSNADAANPAVEDDSAGGRQLASVAARFVSAALRVFGI